MDSGHRPVHHHLQAYRSKTSSTRRTLKLTPPSPDGGWQKQLNTAAASRGVVKQIADNEKKLDDHKHRLVRVRAGRPRRSSWMTRRHS